MKRRNVVLNQDAALGGADQIVEICSTVQALCRYM
jgi:hypothetical protein